MSIIYINPFQFAGTDLLLDDYPGAAAAFSLRQLRTGVTSVARVRRDNDNAEQDFTATEVSDGTLAGWVGAGNNGFVRTWYDQSGNGRHAAQATPASQPRIVSNGAVEANISKPCVNFTVGNGLELANRPLTGSTEPCVFVLGKYVWTGYVDMVFTQSNGGLASHYEIRRTAQPPQNTYEIGTGATLMQGVSSVNNQTSIISSIAASGSSTTSYVNGNLDATQTASITAIGSYPSFIGARVDGFPFRGILHELIIYSTGQTSTRSGIESNINAHYAIY